jgi:hypothetical protein
MPPIDPGLRPQFEARILELELEHRDLDKAIARLSHDLFHDELSIKRMKKRKLLLKDQIASIKRQLDPDILA